jgi:hypothetical protein
MMRGDREVYILNERHREVDINDIEFRRDPDFKFEFEISDFGSSGPFPNFSYPREHLLLPRQARGGRPVCEVGIEESS